MNRLLVIAILFAAPLLTQRAAAQDCLCLVGEGFGLDGFGLDGFGLDGFGLDGFGLDGFGLVEVETPDTTIESTAFLHTGDAPAADAAPGVPMHRTVLWCTSSDDPRCQPAQPSDVPQPRALSGGSVGTTLAALTRLSPRFAIEMTMTPTLGLAPSTGVRSSLDRPPR